MRIMWLNEASSNGKGIALVNVALNADADTIADIEFSRAAILIKIPPAQTKELPGGKIRYLPRDSSVKEEMNFPIIKW